MYMANANQTHANYIPLAHVGACVGCAGIRVGCAGIRVGCAGIRVGCAFSFRYQHIGIGLGNAKTSPWGSRPTRVVSRCSGI